MLQYFLSACSTSLPESRTEMPAKILAFTSILLLAAGVSVAGELSLYGLYHVQTPWGGYYMDEPLNCQQGPCSPHTFTNTLILHFNAFQELQDELMGAEEGIVRANELGYKVILGLAHLLQERNYNIEFFEHELGMLALRLRQAGLLNSESIHAIYLFDEPKIFSLSVEDQYIAIDMVHRYMSGFPIIVNYSPEEILDPELAIPETVDIVSFDAYFFYENNPMTFSRMALENYLDGFMEQIRRKAPGKPVIYIGQSFASNRGHFMPSVEQMSWMLEYSMDVEKNPEIIGHFWFQVPTVIDEEEEEFVFRGIIDFPEQLEYQRQMGLQIISNLEE